MAWDTYLVMGLVTSVVGFYLAKGLFPKCPKCQAKMKYVGAVDPQFDKASEGDRSARLSDLRLKLFGRVSPHDRIQFYYACPKCGEELGQSGKNQSAK